MNAQDLPDVPKHITYAEEAVLSQKYWRDTATVAAAPESNTTANLSPIYAWSREIVTIAFSAKDVVNKDNGSHHSLGYNHDGKAFFGYVWPSHESENENVVNYAKTRENISLYRRNTESGVWKKFANGE
jgi:hypothetical protein